MSYKNLVGPHNWYALVKSCIIVNHRVLLVRHHLKYVWFTKFLVEVKNALLGYPKKQKKLSVSGGGARPPTTDSALDPAGGPPQTSERTYSQLQSCHYTTGLHLFLIHITCCVVVRRV